MANRYVRLHNKPEGAGEPGTLIGFSASAYPHGDSMEAFERYFEANRQEVRHLHWDDKQDRELLAALGGVSAGYLEVVPPLNDEQLPDLGKLCMEHVNPRRNFGFLIDNRQTLLPLRPFDLRGEYIARWEQPADPGLNQNYPGLTPG